MQVALAEPQAAATWPSTQEEEVGDSNLFGALRNVYRRNPKLFWLRAVLIVLILFGLRLLFWVYRGGDCPLMHFGPKRDLATRPKLCLAQPGLLSPLFPACSMEMCCQTRRNCTMREGFHWDNNMGEMVENYCRCDFGGPARGPDCPKHGQFKCTICKSGFKLNASRCTIRDGYFITRRGEVMINRCTCEHGRPARGAYCPKAKQTNCTICDHRFSHVKLDASRGNCTISDGYFWDGNRAMINRCTCEHGHPAVFEQCPWHSQENCSYCFPDYEILFYGARRVCVLPAAPAMHSGIASVLQGEGKFFVYVLPSGQAWAAGNNIVGQLGDKTTKSHYRPRLVMQGTRIKEVAMGGMGSLFLARNGVVYGVGRIQSDRWLIRKPIILRRDVKHVSTSGPHFARYSWYLLTDGTLIRNPSLEDAKAIHTHVEQISAQGVGDLPMVLTTAGTAFALVDLSSHVTRSVKVADSVRQVSSNTGVALVLKRNGDVWGGIMPYCEDRPSMTNSRNVDFVSNVSSIANRGSFHLRLLVPNASRIFAGRCSAFVLKRNGDLLAMGDNSEGQLGVPGNFIPWGQPVRVDISERVREVFPGIGFTVFITKSGNILGTGDNSYGQFGDGSTFSRTKPLGCDRGGDLVSAGVLRINMPATMCGYCPPGHYAKLHVCQACPATMYSHHVIRGDSGCTPCPAGMEPTRHQNSCWIPDKMQFLKTQLQSTYSSVIVYLLVVACAYIIRRYAMDLTYVALANEEVPVRHGRYRQRIWRVLRMPQPYKWGAKVHGGLDISDWGVLLTWFAESEPSGNFADFQADYLLASLTTCLLVYGPLLPLLMLVLPRPLYIIVEIVYDCLELFVTFKSRFKVTWWLYSLNIVSTLFDLLLLKGPEGVEMIVSDKLPGMKELLDFFDPIGLTALSQDINADSCELPVTEISGFAKDDVVQILGTHGVEEHEIIDIKIREKIIVIAAPGLTMSHPHRTAVRRKVE